MNENGHWKGIFSPSVTVFDGRGEIDAAGTKEHVDFLIEGGVDGVICLAVTGEFTSLSVEERVKIIDITLAEAGDRVPVLVGVTSTTTRESLALASHAREAGASGVFLMPPPGLRLTDTELYSHFQLVARAIPALHVQIYNSPASGQNLDVAFLERLSRIDNVASLKEGNPAQIADDVFNFGEKMAVFCARDTYLLETLAVGGAGATSVVACVAPQLAIDVWRAWQDGDIRRAQLAHARLIPVIRALVTPSYPAPIKAALDMVGLRGGPLRLPLAELAESEKSALRATLSNAGLL